MGISRRSVPWNNLGCFREALENQSFIGRDAALLAVSRAELLVRDFLAGASAREENHVLDTP